MIILAKINLFGHSADVASLLREALFLHMGTLLAALLYFHKDIIKIVQSPFNKGDIETKQVFKFLLISTLISGTIGLLIFMLIENLAQFGLSGRIVTSATGVLLLITGLVQVRAKKIGFRNADDIKTIESVFLGIVQGLTIIPGFSRSGLTISALLLRKFDKKVALRLSFLMSLPIVLAANIILNFREFANVSYDVIVGVLFSFIFGLLTIHALMKLAEKMNFGYFAVMIGVLTIVAGLI